MTTSDQHEVPRVEQQLDEADGDQRFNPRNPFPEPFQMLIHLVKK